MKLANITVAIFSICSACSAPPLSAQDLTNKTFWRHAALACVQKGWISYLPATMNYVSMLGDQISAGASSEQIKEYSAQANATRSVDSITIQECRSVEMIAVQIQQAEVQSQNERAALDQALDDMGAAWQPAQQNSNPIVSCQHYDWGNVTFCN